MPVVTFDMRIWINTDFCWLLHYIPPFLSGWWFQPLWKIFVKWDDEIPNIWKMMKNESNVPNHQPVVDFIAPFSRRNGIKTVHFLWTSTKQGPTYGSCSQNGEGVERHHLKMIFSLILERQTFFLRLHKAELSILRRSWGYKVQGLGRVDGVSWCCSIGINVKNLTKIQSQTFIPQLPNGRVWCWHNPHATSRWLVQETKKTKTQKMLCMACRQARWGHEVARFGKSQRGTSNPLNQAENSWVVRWVSFCFRQQKLQ